MEHHVNRYPPVVTQWVGDNVDHNIRSLDGLNTFHGMGLFSTSQRQRQEIIVPNQVPRLQSCSE